MPSSVNLPNVFHTDDPTTLKSELERYAQGMDEFLRTLLNEPPIEMTRPNPVALTFGTCARVSPITGTTTILQLPRPNVKNVGKRCAVRRDSTDGEVLIYAVGLNGARACLVAGAARYRMANDIHFVEFLFDGDYFPSRAGAGS